MGRVVATGGNNAMESCCGLLPKNLLNRQTYWPAPVELVRHL
jgi:hypothetical protein